MPRSRKLYLWDVRDAIYHIQYFVRSLTLDQFRNNILIKSAVERQYEIVGEALKQMEALFPGSSVSLPKVKAVIGMRDRLAHGYFSIGADLLWNAAKGELPGLYLA